MAGSGEDIILTTNSPAAATFMPPVRPMPPPGPSQRQPSGMRGGGNSGRRPSRSKYKDLKLKLIILGLNGYDGTERSLHL